MRYQNVIARGLRALIPAAEAPDGKRVRLRTLVLIRWIAVLGQTAALAIVYVSLGYDLPILPAALLVAASIGLNLYTSFRQPGSVWLGDQAAAFYVGYDLIQLSLLLALTGGLTNPFSILILAPVVVSASVLSRKSTVILSVLAVVAASALALWHLPLPWPGGLGLPALYVLGIWAALVLAVIFIAGYVFSLAAEAQRMSDALSATQMALAREQKLSALGGLAAAAAHELGSPLSTIAVVARDLSREVSADSPLREDADLLLHESSRCRDILAQLAQKPESDGGPPYNRLPLSALAEAAGQPYATGRVAIETTRHPRDGSDQPEVPRSPEILHGLGTLIQNAERFAHSRVEVAVSWSEHDAEIAVRDDGPGFAADILPHLGEPYISSGSQNGQGDEHMGLGIFIARNLLARTGAEVRFGNRDEGGAEVSMRWRRRALETVPTGETPIEEERVQ